MNTMISLKKFIDEEVRRVLREDLGATTGPTSTTKPNEPSPSTGKPPSGTLPSRGGKSNKSPETDPFGTSEQPTSPEGDQEQEEENLTPEEDVMKVATDLSKQTRDIPTILKGVKATIQKRYPNPTQASGLINTLEGSPDESLKAVASQLRRFLGIR